MKIKSIKCLGKGSTYSPEMAGDQHNYILSSEPGHPVHKNSHATAYCIMSFQCLYLKAHYPEEWWASVMSICHPDKLPRYMSTARVENVKFGNIHCDNLTAEFTVNDNQVTPGLKSIKGIGEKVAAAYSGGGPYRTLDDFINKNGKSKTVLERLIKLGAFEHLYPNRKATWYYYLYRYGTGEFIDGKKKIKVTTLKRRLEALFMKTPEEFEKEKQIEIEEYKKLYPNKNVPKRLLNKKQKKPKLTMEEITNVTENDFTLEEILAFEKQYLGYYWNSALDVYETTGNLTIEDAKQTCQNNDYALIECVIEDIQVRTTKNGNSYRRLTVTDGVEEAGLTLWNDAYAGNDTRIFEPGTGILVPVSWNPKYNSFTVLHNSEVVIDKLDKKDGIS